MGRKLEFEKRLRKAIAALYSVSRWGIRIECDEATETYYLRLPQKRGFQRDRRDDDEFILVAGGGLVGVSMVSGSEEHEANAELRGGDQGWEPLFQGYAVGDLQGSYNLPGGTERMGLGRDEFYNVTGEVVGEFPSYAAKLSYMSGGAFPPKSADGEAGEGHHGFYIGYTPGQAIQTGDVHGRALSDGSRVILRGCNELGFRQTTADPRRGRYLAWLGITCAEKVTQPAAAVSVQEWFLN